MLERNAIQTPTVVQHHLTDPQPSIPTYLGESTETARSSLTDLFRRHGAISSTSRSPWQPVCSATRRFIINGSFWMAHGDKALPLNRITRVIKSMVVAVTKTMTVMMLTKWMGQRPFCAHRIPWRVSNGVRLTRSNPQWSSHWVGRWGRMRRRWWKRGSSNIHRYCLEHMKERKRKVHFK